MLYLYISFGGPLQLGVVLVQNILLAVNPFTAFLQKACGPGKNILPSCTQKSVVIDYLKTQVLDFVHFYL